MENVAYHCLKLMLVVFPYMELWLGSFWGGGYLRMCMYEDKLITNGKDETKTQEVTHRNFRYPKHR